MINKRGTIVLRDIVFMMLIVSVIFIFAGIFVSEMADDYSNTDMESEWAITGTNSISDSIFYDTVENVSDTGNELKDEDTGILSLLGGALTGAGKALFLVLNAPGTIADLVAGTLEDMEIGTGIIKPLTLFIKTILWAIIIFTIASAFLPGGNIAKSYYLFF